MRHLTAAVALLCAAIATPLAIASDITVCPSGCDHSTIKSAINSAGNGDVILVSAGQYDERNMDTKRSITIQGEVDKSGAPAVIINSNGSKRIFLADDGQDVVLRNLVMQNGDGDEGGAVKIDGNSHIDFDNCIIRDNEGKKGAGVYVNSGSATFTSCRFENNESEDEGGALHLNSSSATLTDCTFVGNETDKDGAGIYANSSPVTLVGCEISDNDADGDGGGIYRNSSTVKLTDTIVCGNRPNDQIEGSWQDLGGNCVEVSCDDCQTDCIADINQDGIVDSGDLGLVIAAWGSSDQACDLDGNGTVGGGDIAYVLGYWDSCVVE